MKSILKAESSAVDSIDKPKYCVYCGTVATQEAFFDTGNSIVVEKYCDVCMGRVNLRLGAPSYHYGMMKLLK